MHLTSTLRGWVYPVTYKRFGYADVFGRPHSATQSTFHESYIARLRPLTSIASTAYGSAAFDG